LKQALINLKRVDLLCMMENFYLVRAYKKKVSIYIQDKMNVSLMHTKIKIKNQVFEYVLIDILVP
jgi:hypothetical protein